MPGTAFVTVTPLADVIDARMRSWVVGATLFTGFGALALVLAALGLYSVIGSGGFRVVHGIPFSTDRYPNMAMIDPNRDAIADLDGDGKADIVISIPRMPSPSCSVGEAVGLADGDSVGPG